MKNSFSNAFQYLIGFFRFTLNTLYQKVEHCCRASPFLRALKTLFWTQYTKVCESEKVVKELKIFNQNTNFALKLWVSTPLGPGILSLSQTGDRIIHSTMLLI